MSNLRVAGFLSAIAVLALFIIPSVAEAKFRSGGSFGSRGSKTYQAPPTTRTAPRTAQPIQRSTVPRTATNSRPNVTKPGMFGSMSRGGFMAGLLGAGLLGLLFGYGLSGGLGGIAAFLGLIAQLALVALLAMLLFSWLQRRKQPAPAMARASGNSRYAEPEARGHEQQFRSMSSNDGGGRRSRYDDTGETPTRPLKLAEEDFNSFERLLGEVQDAYAREDMDTLRRIATDEMCGYFADDIEANKEEGHAIRISGVKLLQGDLAEAWKEPGGEYATVAMRFSIADAVVDRKSGKVIEGSLTDTQELTEIWTFLRRPGGTAADWQLTAVQPAEGDEEA